MTSYGFTLMTELHGPRELVDQAVAAEAAGFDFAAMSDHFHPWLESQGNSPFAWSVLGTVAERTERMDLMTMVTCPFLRYHPAVVAQAAATVQILCDGRFTLGLGAGENLNEHVIGAGWPPVPVRHEMLDESIEIMRRLFQGGEHHFRGEHLTLESARLYSLPDTPPPLAVAAGGPDAARLAGEAGDALITVAPDPELIDAYREAGGTGPTYGQVGLSWAPDEEQGRKQALELFRFFSGGWPVMSELATPAAFEAATKTVREEDVAELMPCGPQPELHVEAIRRFEEAGYDHVAVVQAGGDMNGFLRFWEEEVRPKLG
ncbi:MAG TPA: TIGR03557 family F420-dependent LLM class oxidoreductase [Acidimicrobiia bacterium]|nr:TIGR03557 family F420-dependent LLM class oxidoreductase [Acidimicrobiia bacterium]